MTGDIGFDIFAIYKVGDGRRDIWSGSLRLTAENYVGGAGLGEFYSLKGERTNLSSAIYVCNKMEDSARGA